MKSIQLTKGMTAIVDDEDFDKVNSLNWYAHESEEGRFYARHDFYFGMEDGKEKRKRVFLHRFLMNIEDPKVKVDHKNGDTMDNRKENLRIASNQENCCNKSRLSTNNTSGFRGVSKRSDPRYVRKYEAYIKVEGKRKHLGTFFTAEEAAKAFDKAAKQIYGEFCGKLNYE